MSVMASVLSQAVCCVLQLAGRWLVVGNSYVSLYLQREIGLSAALGAIQTYCLKVCLPIASLLYVLCTLDSSC